MNFSHIEAFWQGEWQKSEAFKFDNNNLQGKKPYYVLEMFPYPSGKIHMGHVRNYTIGDVIARVRSMQGYKVLHPMGFDAFGLPAENAAIETNSHPKKWTLENIEQMKTTIKRLGFSYDWDREIATCLPSYYKHEQEMFIKFYEAGLAYQKKSFVNWDPVDNTVLANEQVIDGKGWRSGATVERRELKQWFLKVSDFSEDLLADLDTLPHWEEKVKTMQKNWIGKSIGAEVNFAIEPINFSQKHEMANGLLANFETKNLKARLFNSDDFDLLYKLHSNPEVMANIGSGKAKSKEEVEAQFANITLNSENTVFAVFDKSTEEFIGRVGFSKFNSIIKSDSDINAYELGYCFMPQFWGKGYARELGLAILDLFFTKLKIDKKIYAKATDRNEKSINNLLALGFTENGQTKSEGLSPAKIYSLTADGWANLTSTINVFTTRPDTLYGASFIAISPLHQLVNALSPLFEEQVHKFVEKQKNIKVATQDLETMEKEGVFTGLYATNPLAGVKLACEGNYFSHNLEKLPIYIANFVLMDYGTGAVFACPAHDERDWDFAKKYNLPIRQVVAGNPQNIIESDRLTICPTTSKNEPDINALHSDPDVVKYLDGYKGDASKYIASKKGKLNLAIYDKTNNNFVGRGGIYTFQNLDGERHTDNTLLEISYILSSNNWGKGYGTEVARALSHYCFANLGVDKICAVINEKHEQSRKILEKIGFEHNGTKFVNATYGLESYFELEKQDFYNIVKASEVVKCSAGLGFAVNSPPFEGLESGEVKTKIIETLSAGGFAKAVTNYKLRDWGVSRQRYWGCPIPMVYCKTCGTIPEKLENLPVELPDDVDLKKAGSPLENHPTWKKCKCPKCGGEATRETDTFDTFFESSWYFLRFLYPNLETAGFDSKTVDNFLPVNEYIGGIEHAILHLLYARFFVKALKKIGLLNTSEPFKRLITQGMICHKTYKNKQTGKWISPEEAGKLSAELVEVGDSIKMSKSKKNIVDPEAIIEKYGADTARLFVLSDSPPEKDIDWSEEGVSGCNKFIKRFYAAASEFAPKYLALAATEPNKTAAFKIANKILFEYLQAFDAMVLNKCVAKCRELFNELASFGADEDKFVIFTYLVKMLNPIIPHTCEQIWCDFWADFARKKMLCTQSLPLVDVSVITSSTITMAVQVNGKMRGSIDIAIYANQETAQTQSLDLETVRRQLQGGLAIKKIIFVPNKVINFIVG